MLDEITKNAVELPVECQDWLLTLAKGMAFTRECVLRQNRIKRGAKGAEGK